MTYFQSITYLLKWQKIILWSLCSSFYDYAFLKPFLTWFLFYYIVLPIFFFFCFCFVYRFVAVFLFIFLLPIFIVIFVCFCCCCVFLYFFSKFPCRVYYDRAFVTAVTQKPLFSIKKKTTKIKFVVVLWYRSCVTIKRRRFPD